MIFTRTAIRRPVTVLMCVLVVIVLGFVSLTSLPLDFMPAVNLPVAVVMTTYSGAGPSEVENIVTIPLEEVLSTVGSLKNITSQSQEGMSLVIMEFEDATDMNFAMLDIREKVDLAKMFLPSEVKSPTVIKADLSMMPVLYMSVAGDMGAMELKDYTENEIKPAVEKIEGVASVSITGGKTREILVELRPDRMELYKVSMTQISQILQSENLNLPGGVTNAGDRALTIRNSGQFKNIEEIKALPIPLPTGVTLRLSDLAEVTDRAKKDESIARLNGKEAVLLSVQKQSSANTVQVVNKIKDGIAKVDTRGLETEIIFDQAQFVEFSIRAVAENAMLGALLAIVILLIFLKSWKMTLIVGTSIPVSIIATFVLIYFSGLTLNMLSLGGLALGVGMLVDNSIVVIENVYRHFTKGESRLDAAVNGTKEILTAVIASTLTTVVVFLPIVFVTGFVSQIFKELALTVCFSLLCSLVVSLTVVPALCARMLDENLLSYQKPGENKKGFLAGATRKIDKVLNKVDHTYGRLLGWALRRKKTVIFGAAAIFLSSMALLFFVGAELLPASDEGQISVSISLPKGARLSDTNEITRKMEELVSQYPDVEKVSTSIGGTEAEANTASITVVLTDKEKRGISTAETAEAIRKEAARIPGAKIGVEEVSSVMGSMGGMGMGGGISVSIKGRDTEVLKEIAKITEKIVSEVEGTREVSSSLSKGQPEVKITVDRDKAAGLGLTGYQVASALRTAVEGSVVTRLKEEGKEIDVRLKYPDSETDSLQNLASVSIMTPAGVSVPLSSLVKMELGDGPSAIMRENRQRVVTVSAAIYGRDLGSINADIEERLKGVALPDGYSFDFGGQYEMMMDAFYSLSLVILLAVLLVYMVMAAQFESLLDPFILLFSIPLAFTGSAVMLFLLRKTINISSLIGVIILVGVVVNNAIVLIDYVKQLRASGMMRDEAILKAGPTRLRPILMTTLTTVLGLLPMLVSQARGAELQASMAAVVIGGLLTSTVLTLIFIPVLYAVFDSAKIKGKKRRAVKKAKRLAKASADIEEASDFI